MSSKFKEDEVTELKKSTSELKEAIVSIVAILNKHQKGRLYFGIKDNGTVVGQEIGSKTLRDVSEAITTQIEPKIYPSVSNVKIEDKDCILVEFEGDNLPYDADGRPYIRVSDQDKRLSIEEMRKILIKTAKKENWDSLISDKTVDDVNEEILKDYIKRGREVKRIPFDYTNKEDVLNKLRLLKGNKLLNAGKVLFCDDNRVVLQMAIFATNTKTTFIDIDRIEGNVFDLIKAGQEYIRKNIIWNVEITDRRKEYPEIPINSIREAIINSYAHKSFEDPKGVEISIFKDRVEIYNPGAFPEEYTPKDYIENKAHSIFRNPLIAEILYKSQDAETYSSGIRRMYEECKANGVKLDFREEKTGFTIIFYRKSFYNKNSTINNENATINEKSSTINNENATIKIEEKILEIRGKYPKLKDIYIAIIENILENTDITQEDLSNILGKSRNAISRNIKKLKELGIIERIGSNKNGYWKVK